MTFEIPDDRTPEILEKLKQLEKLVTSPVIPEWLNDEQCWKLKGGMALSTYRNSRWFQCKGGIPDGRVGGRKVWNKKSVLEWLPIADSDLEQYHELHKTGARKKD